MAVSEADIINIRLQIAALQQRVSRLESTVLTLQNDLAKVKKG